MTGRRLIVSLYPRAWQARYGEEFEALLEDRPLNLAAAVDVVRGALDAHVHPVVDRIARANPWPRRGWRLTGGAAMVGGLVWPLALITAQLGLVDSRIAGVLVLAGSVVLVAVLLVGSLLPGMRRRPATWIASGIGSLGGFATVAGLLAMETSGDAPIFLGQSAWMLWAVGLGGLGLGSMLFTLAAYRAWFPTSRFVRLFEVGAGVWIVAFVTGVGGLALGGLLILPALIASGVAWVAIGLEISRAPRDRRRAPA